MSLDIFSAVRGWASGVQAYQAGQKEQANQIWGELESQMKLMASAQGIRQSAQLHPLQVQAQRENIATTKQAREFGAEEQPIIMRDIKAKTEISEMALNKIKALEQALQEQGIDTTTLDVQKIIQGIEESKLATETAKESLPYVSGNIKLEFDTNITKLLTARKNLRLIESEIEKNKITGNDNSLAERKYKDEKEKERLAAEALRRFAPSLTPADVDAMKDLQGVGVIKTDADIRADEAHRQAMEAPEREKLNKAETEARGLYDMVNSVITHVEGGADLSTVVFSAKMLDGVKDPELKAWAMDTAGRSTDPAIFWGFVIDRAYSLGSEQPSSQVIQNIKKAIINAKARSYKQTTGGSSTNPTTGKSWEEKLDQARPGR